MAIRTTSGVCRRSARAWLTRVGISFALATASVAGLAQAAQEKWGPPFQLAAPQTLDVLAPQLALSSDGSAAAAFGFQDVDVPGSSQGVLTLRSPTGAISGPQTIAPARQILGVAYNGRSVELLTGTSATGQTCCSEAQAIQVDGSGGIVGRPRTLVGGLAGTTTGRLLTLADGQMLAAVATERGVWVVQSSRGNRFAGQHLLTRTGQMPQALAATPLGAGSSLVAWTAATGPAGAADPRSIDGATGSRTSAPRRVRTLVTVPAGHRIDEIGVAPRGRDATVTWAESWYDRSGSYHSVVEATDLTPHAGVRMLSAGNRLASGLQFAGDAAGDQAAAWESCTVDDACTVDTAVRRRGGVFGPARSLGATDAAQAPALSVGPRGKALVGWIRAGDPVAAVQALPGQGFGPPTVLSRAGYALDIAVAAGPQHEALAAWSQGTLNPSVVGTVDSGF
ncbi:MAG TPA: hypothetical protein VG371_00390 [Solirubrobacteraceae bacterium]|nr:hypothetical protein [Solirubrobacteraceae bacterium]